MTVAESGVEGVDATRALSVLVGWAFVGSGLYAWGRRPENRLGPLMTLVGYVYLTAQILTQAHAPLLFTSGIWIGDAWVVFFVLFLLSFPHGRLTSTFDLVVISMFALMALPLELLWLLVFDPGDDKNVLLAWPSSTVAGHVDSAQRALVVTASVVLAVRLSRRWIHATPPLRRALVPVLVGSGAILLASILVGLDKFQVEFETARWLVLVAYIAIPLVVLGGILHSRLARSTVGELFIELRDDPAPADLRDVLAGALRDPSLDTRVLVARVRKLRRPRRPAVELPDPDGQQSADADRPGRGARRGAAPRSGAGGRARAARRRHRSCGNRDRERATARRAEGAARRATGIAVPGDRRGAEGTTAPGAQPARRCAAAADRALARAEPPRGAAGSDPDVSARLGLARREIAASLEELREVAHGIHPAVVSGHGLDVALEQLVARAPVPIRLTLEVGERLPEQLEVAAYYLVSESLANVGKHAEASSATVEVIAQRGQRLVEVADDGIGGADTERGSGLRGLADRVEALGGRLRVWSPAGGGTRVRAEMPCAS